MKINLKNNQQKSAGGRREGAGRKLGSPNKVTADVRNIAQEFGPVAVKELARLALHAESETARVAAIKELLDRAYGKSNLQVDITGKLSLEQLVTASIA
jgi:hypothetical protein